MDKVLLYNNNVSVALLERTDGSRYWRMRYIGEDLDGDGLFTVDIEVSEGKKWYQVPTHHKDGHSIEWLQEYRERDWLEDSKR